MRVLLASLLALGACAPQPPAIAGDEAVLRALLADVARGEANLARFPDHRQLCVAPALAASRALAVEAVQTAGRDAEWLADGQGRVLTAAERQQLSAAAGPVLASLAPARVARVEPDWIPAPLQPLADHGCRSAITLSAPAIRDELAFVVVASVCGDNCAGSDLRALRREGDGWRPFATLPLWVT